MAVEGSVTRVECEELRVEIYNPSVAAKLRQSPEKGSPKLRGSKQKQRVLLAETGNQH